MPNPSVPCTGSPDITTLSYGVKYDISGGIPTIILTNASTVINPTQLIWWYVITSPSATPIHSGSLSTPDVNHIAWTTLQIASGSWPLLFGNPPCAQVEFSSNAPYICTLFVKDSAGNTFSLPIIQTITRPNGNTENSCGNFGGAQVTVQVNCNNKNVFCNDSTNFTYNNILTPTVYTNEWILVYPPDPNGNQPTNATVSNTPNVNFPIGYSGDGYVLNLLDFCTYDMGNGATIKVQYKAINPQTGSPGLTFAVLCNINLCKLQCQIQAFYELSKKSCGQVENTALESKMTQMNFLFNQAIIGILQPLCGIDVPKIIREIQKIGNLDPNCNCGCTDNGINFSYPTSPGGSSSGGCCPVSSNVIDSGTGMAPALCPQSYFPAQVKDPTNTTIIGTATDISSLVALLNSYPAWESYGVAFPEGNCKVGWFPATGIITVPNIEVVLGTTPVLPPTIISGCMTILDGSPPGPCTGAGPYPVKVYDSLGTTIIGIANNINDICSLMNANAGWKAYGVVSPIDNCHFQWNLTNGSIIPPCVLVDAQTATSTCVNGTAIYTVAVNDVCQTVAFTLADFPMNVFVDFGLGAGPVFVANVASMGALVSALNAAPSKPASVTFSAGSVLGQVIATNTNCIAYNGTVAITANLGSEDYMLYGSNHNQMTVPSPLAAAQYGLGLATNAVIGKIAGWPSDVRLWHTIRIGGYMLATAPSAGRILMWDISNPLAPILLQNLVLNDTGSGNCFTGNPHTITVSSGSTAIPSYYGLYFPTDTPLLGPVIVYVSESTTGSIWQVNMTTGTVTASFAHTKLLGKCPRCIVNNILYFTQDGDLELVGGLSSGVAEGDIVMLSLATFSSGGLSTTTILLNTSEYVWAASFDGVSTIYFTGENGTLATYDITSDTVTNRYANAFSVAKYRLNTRIFLNAIYASSLIFVGQTTGTQRLITSSLPTIVRTNFANFTPPGGMVANNNTHYNALPLGNCIVLVTYDNWQDSSHAQGGVAVFAVDGTFLGIIQLAAGDIYNVIAIQGISVYAPTTLI